MSHVRLLVAHDRNRELLADWLSTTYEVTAEAGDMTADDLAGTDLCLVDETGFARHEEALREWKETTDPVFAPVVLITEQDPSEQLDPAEWETIDGLYVIDELVSVPVEKAVLYRRLENLLERRDLSKRLESRYERSEARFESLFHATPDPAFVIVDDEVAYVNDALCALLGVDRGMVVGDGLDALPGMDAAALDHLRAQFDAVATGEVAETETIPVESADGERRYVESNVRELTDGGGRGFAVVLRDVTERRERERRFRAVFDQAYQFSGLLDPDGTVVAVNETLVEATGLDRGELVGDDVTAAPWWDDDARDAVEGAVRAAAAGNVTRSQERIETPDGDTVTIDFSVKPVVDDGGDIDLLVAEGRDITPLKERERELERQNERLEEFAGIVSHDLRNPLQVLSGNVASLRSRDDVDHVSDELDSIARATDRMETLIEDLLELARAGERASDPEPVALETVAADAWETVAAPDAALSVDVTDAVVVADPSRLAQLFENLFRNSVEHSDGSVTVSVGRLDGGEGFFVADDGPGIPPEERESVFEAGYTTSEDGSGLGLDIVSEIASAHGWTVAVTESEAGGARFEMRGVDVE